MFINVFSFSESTFSQNFQNIVISPFQGLNITKGKIFLSFFGCISVQSDSTLFEFMDTSVRGLN